MTVKDGEKKGAEMSSGEVPAARPVRWGILATGSIAARMAGDLAAAPDAEAVAVGSRSREAAEAFARRFGIPRAHGDWASLAADPEVDVVYVATPHSAHHRAVATCLAAGKPVLCEKPFTLNAAQAEELFALAERHGVLLMEAMWMCCNPAVRRMRELVREGAIGEVRAVQADFGIDIPYDPAHRLLDPALGGGALLDLGVYPVAFAQLLLGEPDELAAWARLRGGVDLATGMVFGYASGASATLSCSLTADTPRTAAVTGSAGRIEFPRGFFHAAGFLLHRQGRDPEEVKVPGPADSFVPQIGEVVRCLRAGERESPLVPRAHTLAVMRTLDAVRERVGLRYPGE